MVTNYSILFQTHNREYLGRRFVIIEEVFEEQYNLVDNKDGQQPVQRRAQPSEALFVPGKVQLR